jgi:phospholipase A1
MHKLILGLLLSLIQINSFSQELLTDEKSGKIISKTISQRWELDPQDKKGTFRLVSYKPVYVTAGRWSSDPNQQPKSENPDFSLPAPEAYNAYEAKFQLSFKSKLIQSAFFGVGDLWLGYTQVAHWQIYNAELSRVFRELNYEPELLLNFPIKFNVLGFTARTAGVSINHQSNGRDLPRSRSWNRIMFHMGFERKHWQLVLRPWIRLSDEEDENPLITDHIGRGEVTVIYGNKNHVVYGLFTHSFNTRSNRGSAQLNYVFPIRNNLRGHIQCFTGYGETLIDYNHKQTTLGLGVSFVDW